jgi:hypothetical protein
VVVARPAVEFAGDEHTSGSFKQFDGVVRPSGTDRRLCGVRR